jgi:hypothetical protein
MMVKLPGRGNKRRPMGRKPSPHSVRGMPSKYLRDQRKLYAALMEQVRPGGLQIDDIRKIESAYRQARKAHWNQKRKSGEPYIWHPIAVVHCLVLEMGIYDVPAIIAAYLHDAPEDQLKKLLPLYGLNRELAVWLFLTLRYGEHGEQVVMTLRILTRAEWQVDKAEYIRDVKDRGDWRAHAIKFADRWHNVSTLGAKSVESQLREAQMTIDEFPSMLFEYLLHCPREHHYVRDHKGATVTGNLIAVALETWGACDEILRRVRPLVA